MLRSLDVARGGFLITSSKHCRDLRRGFLDVFIFSLNTNKLLLICFNEIQLRNFTLALKVIKCLRSILSSLSDSSWLNTGSNYKLCCSGISQVCSQAVRYKLSTTICRHNIFLLWLRQILVILKSVRCRSAILGLSWTESPGQPNVLWTLKSTNSKYSTSHNVTVGRAAITSSRASSGMEDTRNSLAQISNIRNEFQHLNITTILKIDKFRQNIFLLDDQYLKENKS